MALVGVVHLGLRRTGDAGVGAQGADAADAEQDLLAQAVLGGAAVEAVGHVAVVVGVALDVGVEEQQRHAADLGDPDLREQVGPVRLRDRDHRTVAVLLAEQRDGQLVGVEDGVLLELPALAGERLLEVAGVVEQADTHERYAEVAGGLEVVAGQDAEPAGVLRQDGSDAELRGEVGDPRRRLAAGPAAVPPLTAQVGVEVGLGGAQPVEEALVGGQLLEPIGSDRAEEADRVLLGRLPGLGVDLGEDILRRGVPGPPQVAGEVSQCGEGRGQDRTDRESSNSTHGWTVAENHLIVPIYPHPHRAEPARAASGPRTLVLHARW